MNKLCRICLAFEKTIRFDSIFDDNEKVANDIQILFGLIIPNENTTNESALICHECSSKLQDAIQLRNLCLQSNCFFEQLSMNNAEEEIVYENVEYIKSESDVEDDRLGDYFTVIKSEVFEEYSLEMDDHINEQQYIDNSTLYSNQISYICDKCGEVVENRHRLKLHFKNKHLGKSFKCFICMKQFTRNYDLMTHTRNFHCNFKFFECQQCSKSFSMKWNLTRHVKNQHSGEQLSQQDYIKKNIDAFTCEICGLSFSTESVMHSHKISVHKFIELNELNEKWLKKCPKCDKYMQTKTKLQRHISEVHEKKRLFRCESCFGTFSQKTNLERHIRVVHLEEKPYVCEICGKSFSEKAKLKLHNWTHTGAKPFKCNMCEKSYRRAHHLQKHCLSKHANFMNVK